VQLIIRLAGQAPRRFRPLSSNVRQTQSARISSHPSLSNHALMNVRRSNAAQNAANPWRRWRVARRGMTAVSVCPTFLPTSAVVLKVSQWCLRPRCAAALGHRSAGAGFPESPRSTEWSAAPSFGVGATVPSFTVALPNPSLERTSTGEALGPRGFPAYPPPRGPSASPVPAAQLKR
jgi:hypothetical protein